MADDPAVEKPHVVVVANGTLVVVVEKVGLRRRLLVATTVVHRFIGGLTPRGHRQGGPEATTTHGRRDGSGRAGEIALMTDRGATTECTTPEAKSGSSAS